MLVEHGINDRKVVSCSQRANVCSFVVLSNVRGMRDGMCVVHRDHALYMPMIFIIAPTDCRSECSSTGVIWRSSTDMATRSCIAPS